MRFPPTQLTIPALSTKVCTHSQQTLYSLHSGGPGRLLERDTRLVTEGPRTYSRREELLHLVDNPSVQLLQLGQLRLLV